MPTKKKTVKPRRVGRGGPGRGQGRKSSKLLLQMPQPIASCIKTPGGGSGWIVTFADGSRVQLAVTVPPLNTDLPGVDAQVTGRGVEF